MTPLKLYIVEDGALVEYERVGECNGCGDCCEAKHTICYQVQVAGDTKLDTKLDTDEPGDDFATHEGWTCLWAQGVWWWWFVYDDDEDRQRCSRLDAETRRCTCWMDTIDFPAICRYWPVHPKNIERFPRCSFSFTRAEKTS